MCISVIPIMSIKVALSVCEKIVDGGKSLLVDVSGERMED